MARNGAIERLSYDQLQDLSEQVEAAKRDRKADEAKVVKKKIDDLLKQSGFTVAELYGGMRSLTKTARKAARARYRHPNDPTLTWAGRGRRPFWLIEALAKKGAKLEDFAA